MLKNIPGILNSDLLKVLMEMGQGEEIVISNGNFSAPSIAQKLIRLDGHNVPEVLEVLLRFFPLDVYVEKPVGLMTVTHGDTTKPVIWEEYRRIILESREPFSEFEYVEKFDFYERAKKAYAVIAVAESALCADIILKKGVEI